MIGMYISAALICAASLLVGRAVFVWLGEGRWTWLEPAVGLAALMTIGGVVGRIPETDITAPILMGGLVIASAFALRRRYDLHDTVVPAAIAVVVALLVFTIPFVVSGRWGLLGVGFNNDLGLHLAWSEHLRSGNGPEPWTGYPMGPHAIAVAFATVPSTTLGQAFSGEVLAIGILTAITAVGGLRGVGTGRRALAAVLVAASYLGVSYYTQSAFKETVEALFVLAFALGLPRLRGLFEADPDRKRLLVPAVLLLTGIISAYSFVGIAWPVAIVGLWALSMPEVRAALSPRRLARMLRRRAAVAWVAGAAALVALLAFVGPFGFAEGFGDVAGSNTYGPVSPVEAFGVWPAANYRLNAAGGASLPVLAAAIGIVAFCLALAWWARRDERERTLPVALAACIVLYLLSLPVSGDYSRAKALVILAPLAMLVILRGLLADDDQAGGRTGGRGLLRIARPVVAVVFCVGAAYSSFLALRDAPVGPPGHGAELASFTYKVEDRPTLYAGQDRFAAYELLGADTSVPVVEFPDEDVVENATKPFDTGDAYSPIDFDSFTTQTLNSFRYVVTTAAAWSSHQPENFEEVDRTESYVLWERQEPSEQRRRTLLEGTNAAARLNCVAPESRLFATRQLGRAKVFPDPVIAAKEGWEGGSILGLGEETSQVVEMEPGPHRLSIQYFSPVDVRLSAPGFERVLPAALDGARPNTISLGNDGQFWPAGLYESNGGEVEFTLSVAEPTTIQDITGYDGKAFFGALVALPDEPPETVRLRETCGRWIDWYIGSMGP
jgi:hypothetical protein